MPVHATFHEFGAFHLPRKNYSELFKMQVND